MDPLQSVILRTLKGPDSSQRITREDSTRHSRNIQLGRYTWKYIPLLVNPAGQQGETWVHTHMVLQRPALGYEA